MVDANILTDIDAKLVKACEYFWDRRDAQQKKQDQLGNRDAGTRGAVTGGGHMAAFEHLVAGYLRKLNLPDLKIFIGKSELAENDDCGAALELPGYYRPEKCWDMIVLSGKHLVAAIEFKGMVGSVGKNLNNRAEEAIGNAQDIWTAYREHRFGNAPRPFVGFMLVLEDIDEIHKLKKVHQSHFTVDPVFLLSTDRATKRANSVSYSERYQILCRRLRLESLYTATSFVLVTRPPNLRVTQPAEDSTFRQFMASLIGHAETFKLSIG